MPLYDVYCTKCEEETEELMRLNDTPDRCKCGGERKILVNCRNFKLVYDNKKDICGWGADNYATSQYWREYRKAKEEGRDVKPANAE